MMGLLWLHLPFLCLKEFGVVGLDTYTRGIKDLHKCWTGSLAKRRLCLGPAGVVNCTSLSALSFWVSLFPGKRGWNNTTSPTTTQTPSLRHPSWLNKACTTSKDSESEWLAKDNPETNPITIQPKTESHVAEQAFWVPWPYCSLPGHLFPIKSLALSAHVSPWTIHFWVLDKEPAFGPWKGSCFLQHQEAGACAGELRHSLKFYFLTLKQLMLIS